MAEKYQEENSGTQQENQSEYLRIIDDLSSELNTLSRQVNMVQREFPTDEVTKQFESSMKSLETQNDLLQSAVENLIEERETIKRTLQTQNEDLKATLCDKDQEVFDLQNEITRLQQRPCERCTARAQSERDDRWGPSRNESVEELQRLEIELSRRCKTVNCLKSENARLNEELTDIRRRHAKMKLLQRSGAGGGEGTNNPDATVKLNAVQEKNMEHCKSLQKAAKDIARLQQEVEELRSSEETFSKERDLLQTELIALKESQASQLGIQKSLQEQLQGTIDELYIAKEKLHECMQVKDRSENILRDEVKRFQDVKADMFEKYNKLVEDYNDVLKEYQKLVQIELEKTNQLRAFNAWKDEQIHIEREMHKKYQMLENHVRDMLEDKQILLQKLNETENDNRTLLQAIEEFNSCSLSTQTRSMSSPSRGYTVIATSSSNDPVSKVIENVRKTSRKLSHQRNILEEEASCYFSK